MLKIDDSLVLDVVSSYNTEKYLEGNKICSMR